MSDRDEHMRIYDEAAAEARAKAELGLEWRGDSEFDLVDRRVVPDGSDTP